MRVLVVTAWFPTPEIPGAGIFHLRDAELLAATHEVTVLHTGASRDFDETIGNIRVLHRAMRPNSLATHVGGRAFLRDLIGDFDLLHTMSFPTLLVLATLRPGIPWVHTEHWSGLIWPTASTATNLITKATKRLLRRPNQVVAVGAQLARTIGTIRGDKVTQIPNFVRPPASKTLPVAPSRQQLHLLGIGGLHEHKGPALAIGVVARLRALGIPATLTWAGAGPLEHELREQAAQLRVEEYVHLLGHVPPTELDDVFASANVFIAPTRFETFGVAIAEALAQGLPVVTSGVGGHAAFMPPLASRLTERDVASLTEAIVDLTDDDERLTAIEIREFAAQTFSEDVRRTAYDDVYARAVQAHT